MIHCINSHSKSSRHITAIFERRLRTCVFLTCTKGSLNCSRNRIFRSTQSSPTFGLRRSLFSGHGDRKPTHRSARDAKKSALPARKHFETTYSTFGLILFASINRAQLNYQWYSTSCSIGTIMLQSATSIFQTWPRSTARKGSCRLIFLNTVFSRGRWFTRGWNPQELVASQVLEFFDHSWTHLSSRLDLHTTITLITGILEEVCLDPSSVTRFSIAQRMS